MSFKTLILVALVAAASASHEGGYVYEKPLPVPLPLTPLLPATDDKLIVKHETPAQYEFQYGVHDSHTGDIKEAHEVRNGDDVQGHYSLIDADGYKRTVNYVSSADSGFEATVDREPLVGAIVKSVVAEPVPFEKTILAEPTPLLKSVVAESELLPKTVIAEPTPLLKTVVAEPALLPKTVIAEPTPLLKTVVAEPAFFPKTVVAEPTPLLKTVLAEPTLFPKTVVAEPTPLLKTVVADQAFTPKFFEHSAPTFYAHTSGELPKTPQPLFLNGPSYAHSEQYFKTAIPASYASGTPYFTKTLLKGAEISQAAIPREFVDARLEYSPLLTKGSVAISGDAGLLRTTGFGGAALLPHVPTLKLGSPIALAGKNLIGTLSGWS